MYANFLALCSFTVRLSRHILTRWWSEDVMVHTELLVAPAF